ncbi:MAG: carbohydrate porin [Ignavibacteriales bacterium]|nr:carbohydrate porin [Ignavibacteriales bacterium]
MTGRTIISAIVTLLWLLIFLSGPATASTDPDSNAVALFAARDEGPSIPSPVSSQSLMPRTGGISTVGFFEQDRLVGAFFGLKQGLSDAGVDYTISYRSDIISNISGGIRDGNNYIYQFDYSATVNLQQWTGWQGATLYVQGLSNNGNSIKEFSGDAQGPSNLEAFHTTKLYQAWIEQKLLGGDLSLRAGLYDLNSEFYVTNGAGLFLNSSFGVGIDLAQSGIGGPSIFPNTSLALRIKVSLTPAFTLQAAIIDGAPGLPGEPSATGFSISRHDGALLIGEAGYSFDPSSVAAQTTVTVGAWRYTSSFIDLTGTDDARNPPMRTDNAGVYVSASRQIYASATSTTEGLAAFVRYGMANGSINTFSHNFSCGLVYTGLIPGRESDVCGVALTRAQTGSAYRFAAVAAGDPIPGTESTIEATYRLIPAAWCALQFDVQQIINPGTSGTLADATVAGMRLELQF